MVFVVRLEPGVGRGTAYPHPEYDDAAFFEHDLGVVVLDEPIELDDYGQLPTLDYLDQFAGGPNNEERFEAVGYGLEKSRVNVAEGGDTRRKANLKLINVQSDVYAVFSANKGTTHQGGTCSVTRAARSSTTPATPRSSWRSTRGPRTTAVPASPGRTGWTSPTT